MTKILTSVLGLTLLAVSAASPAYADHEKDIFIDEVEVRSGVTAEIHLRVYQNTEVPCQSSTVLAIHGAGSTAKSLEPLARELVQAPVKGRPVCRVVAMDLPGHGLSPIPNGALYGELALEDYAAAVLGVLERLPAVGIHPTTIVGHSMGGIVIQLSQQALVNRGTNLRTAFDIDHVVLLAPAIPAAVPYAFRDNPEGALIISLFMRDDPVRGQVIDLPPDVFRSMVFTTLDGTLAANATTLEEIAASGWISPESVTALGSLIGMAPYSPPEVEHGVFSRVSGTRLDMVAFEQDSLILASDLGPLFSYLTGEIVSPGFAVGSGFVVIESEIATHGLPQVDPEYMLEAVDGFVAFP